MTMQDDEKTRAIVKITRVRREPDAMYAFAMTADREEVYVSARMVEKYDLTPDKEGVTLRALLVENDHPSTPYRLAAILETISDEDSETMNGIEALREELRRRGRELADCRRTVTQLRDEICELKTSATMCAECGGKGRIPNRDPNVRMNPRRCPACNGKGC